MLKFGCRGHNFTGLEKNLNSSLFFSRGVNRQTDRWILKIILPGFWIQSKILTDFRILQLQRIVDSSIFGPRFWTLHVIQIFLPVFQIQGENGRADLVNKS